MKGTVAHRSLGLFMLAWVVASVAGCARQGMVTPAARAESYGGALDLDYEGALDPTSQLALGTFKLEGTPTAVTGDQARALLPLWQALSGTALKGDRERAAVLAQIEGGMRPEQVSAIVAMRLTGEDLQSWAQEQGRSVARTGVGRGQGGAPNLTEDQRAQMRQQLQNMTEDERATRRAQFGAASGAPAAGSAPLGDQGLIAALIQWLQVRSGAAIARTRVRSEPIETAAPTKTAPAAALPAVTDRSTAAPPTATALPVAQATQPPTPTLSPTPEPALHVVRAGESLAALAGAYGVSVQDMVEANAIRDPDKIEVGQELVIPGPARIPTPAAGREGSAPAAATPLPALRHVPDTDPGPPFSIQISANRAYPDPLVEKSRTYLVTGIVRNDGDETYSLSALHVTFYDAEGFRGWFRKAPVPWRTGGDWLWHGQVDAEVGALLLAPGQAWPFSVKIIAQDMASFLIHPDAVPTEREPAPVELSGVQVQSDGTGYVRITGAARNDGAFKVKNVTVSGALFDASGQMVSVGTVYLLDEDISPGQAVRFDLRIARAPYVRYQIYAHAERDWN